MIDSPVTNRHGDTIAIGQLWLDHPGRTVRRTLRVDRFDSAGPNAIAAVCTVVSAHNQDTGETTEPGRIVSIKVDSLHTTPAGNGYHRHPE